MSFSWSPLSSAAAALAPGTECDLYLDWHTGSDGDLITDTIAAASCRPTSPGDTPEVYPGTTLTAMRIETDSASPISGFVKTAAALYDIGDTTQGARYDHTADYEDIVTADVSSAPNIMSMGFLFKTALSTPWAWYALSGMNGSGEWAMLAVRYFDSQQHFYLHTSQGYSSTAIDVSNNTWYWITIQYNATAGYAYMEVYLASTMAKVGSTLSLAFAASPPTVDYWQIGQGANQGNWEAAYSWYGPVIFDWTDGTFPLLPEVEAAAPIDLVADEGSQQQAGDEAALTQVHVLTAAEGTQDQSGDNAALTQVHQLTADEGAQTQLGDNATLEITIALVPAEGSQDQAGDEATLTQLHVLAPAEGTQDQAGDNAALTQVHALTPAEGSQDQAGDPATITVDPITLAPAEGVQEQAGDQADLTQVHALTPAEGVQTQLGDEATIEVTVPPIDLYAAEGAQDQAGDPADLTQVHILAPDEGAQLQIGDEATLGLDLPIDLLASAGSQDQAGDTPALTQVHNLETEEPEMLLDGGLEDWIDANNLRYWTEGYGGGRVTRDAGAYQGSYCARLHYILYDSVIEQQRTLQKEREYRFSFYGRCPGGMGAEFLELWIYTTFQGEYTPRYLQFDGSWENAGFIIAPIFDFWSEFEQKFTLPAQSNGAVGIAFHYASTPLDALVDSVTLRLFDAARQEQAGDGASLIVGLLTTYEFVDRLLLEERIKAGRASRGIETRALQTRAPKLRIRPRIERAHLHDTTPEHRLRRMQ